MITIRLLHLARFSGAITALLLPVFVFAQATTTPTSPTQFSSSGIFGCSGQSSAIPVGILTAQTVGQTAGQLTGQTTGQMSAIGGVYVPVSDAAVTQNTGYIVQNTGYIVQNTGYTVQNTGYIVQNTGNTVINTGNIVTNTATLVYKECVLDILQKRIAEQALSDLVNSILTSANTGRGGAPKFVVDKRLEERTWNDETLVQVLQNDMQNICSPYQGQVRATIAREYMKSTRTPADAYSCSANVANLQQMYQGTFTDWDTFTALTSDLSNNPLGGYVMATLGAEREIDIENEILNSHWNWGQGYYPDFDRTQVPTGTGTRTVRRAVTPAYVVAQITRQAYMSGIVQLENTDEIGEIISATFAGLSNQIMTSPSGFTGISGGSGGANSYLNQLANNSTQALRNTATGIGISIASNALDIEQRYNAVKQQLISVLNQTADQLRAAEDQCWAKVVPAVQALAALGGCAAGDATCTPTTINLNISTSSLSISGGSVNLTLAAGVSILNATPFSLPGANALIENATLAVSSRSASTTVAQSAVTLLVNSPLPQATPSAGGSVALSTAATSLFGPGTLSLKLRPGMLFPAGTTQVLLGFTTPFTQAITSIIVGAARMWADPIIAQQVTPLLAQAQADLDASNQALILLAQLQTDLQSTNPQIQQAALLRLDALVAQRLVHTAGDLQAAQTQLANTANAGQQLVQSTLAGWSSGGNWCNVNNPNVVQAWLDKWKI